MVLSKHAAMRMQQRGLSPQVVNWLVMYGRVEHQRGGAKLYYFNKKRRFAIKNDLGREALRGYSKCLSAYMVCSESTVITIGHRYRRIVRH